MSTSWPDLQLNPAQLSSSDIDISMCAYNSSLQVRPIYNYTARTGIIPAKVLINKYSGFWDCFFYYISNRIINH